MPDAAARAPHRPARPAARRPRRHPHRQRGAALLTAMIIVALVATLATSMLWQQWRAVQVEAAERARAQSGWVLAGAIDWARLILSEAARGQGKNVTALGQPWSVPLEEARLSTFLAADQSNNASDDNDGPDAFLSGFITDAQSRYNLRRLMGPPPGNDDDRIAREVETEIFENLCVSVGVSKEVADRIVSGLTVAAGSEAAGFIAPNSVAQLAWLGVDADSVRILEPFVTLLPDPAVGVNINTASREVIAAVARVDLATAERTIQMRPRDGYAQVQEFAEQITKDAALLQALTSRISVKSNYFDVRGRLRWSDRILEQRSLVQRSDGAPTKVTVIRQERVSSRDAGGS